MGVSTFRTSPELPQELAGMLPSIEALEHELDVEVIPELNAHSETGQTETSNELKK